MTGLSMWAMQIPLRSSSKVYIQNPHSCYFVNDYLVYEVRFEKSKTDLEPILGEAMVIPNPSELTTMSVTITLSQISTKGRLEIMDVYGKIEETIIFDADKIARFYGPVEDVITITAKKYK